MIEIARLPEPSALMNRTLVPRSLLAEPGEPRHVSSIIVAMSKQMDMIRHEAVREDRNTGFQRAAQKVREHKIDLGWAREKGPALSRAVRQETSHETTVRSGIESRAAVAHPAAISNPGAIWPAPWARQP